MWYFFNPKFTVILAVKTNSHEYFLNENIRSRRFPKPWMYKGTTKSQVLDEVM